MSESVEIKGFCPVCEESYGACWRDERMRGRRWSCGAVNVLEGGARGGFLDEDRGIGKVVGSSRVVTEEKEMVVEEGNEERGKRKMIAISTAVGVVDDGKSSKNEQGNDVGVGPVQHIEGNQRRGSNYKKRKDQGWRKRKVWKRMKEQQQEQEQQEQQQKGLENTSTSQQQPDATNDNTSITIQQQQQKQKQNSSTKSTTSTSPITSQNYSIKTNEKPDVDTKLSNRAIKKAIREMNIQQQQNPIPDSIHSKNEKETIDSGEEGSETILRGG
ncbi:MAG: hypothetical protein M1812_007656 [Candelaria pacifica]|nr:MAG: hypothetical protein M1812_007656 [Candelaria pacifica]